MVEIAARTTLTPMKVLEALLAEQPGRQVGFFQKSSETSGKFEPEMTVIGFNPKLSCTVKGETNPFPLIKQQSGLGMGYLTYESVRFKEPVLNRAPGGFGTLPSDAISSEFAVFHHYLVFRHRDGKIDWIADETPFDLDDLLKRSEALVEKKVNTQSQAELKPEDLKCSLGREGYIRGVKKLKEHILAGDIFQAVLSDRFEVELKVSPFEVFRTLVQMGTSAYQVYLSTPERTVFGASPELLLSVRGAKLETHPIAGTRPRGKTAEEERKLEQELTSDIKENAEHLMLVDLARNDLGRISKPGTVRVSERNVIKRFPSVMHIVSKVVGELRSDCTASDALASCYPAGTLSGAPKIRAMQLISEIEGKARGFYGGTFFLAEPNGDLEACISIRCMEVVGTRGFIQAGAGIVMDSVPESEYQEVLHKTRTLRRAVAVAHEGASR